MIAKKNRLSENEVKKVLSKRKPFFSYGLIANTFPNRLGYARCGIVLSGKQTKGSVNRNFWRRLSYDTSFPYLEKASLDIVFIAKKGTIFDYKNLEQREEFEKNIKFLWKLIQNPQNKP
ncbi:ribonuclease P protein component, partial [Candidatus Gracilibacteria bacterium]|nr:ribonuclease P protein component [Candidatus Gracilibacteria bacterium]